MPYEAVSMNGGVLFVGLHRRAYLNKYIHTYVYLYGPLILGNSHLAIVRIALSFQTRFRNPEELAVSSWPSTYCRKVGLNPNAKHLTSNCRNPLLVGSIYNLYRRGFERRTHKIMALVVNSSRSVAWSRNPERTLQEFSKATLRPPKSERRDHDLRITGPSYL